MLTATELQEELNKSDIELRAAQKKNIDLRDQLHQAKTNIKHKFAVGDKVYVLCDERRRLKVFSTDAGWLEILRAEIYEGTISELIFNQNALTKTPMYRLQLGSDIMSFYEKEIFSSSESASEVLKTKMQDELVQAKTFVSRLEEVCNQEIVILNSYERRYDGDGDDV